jgi:hypothetical protein
MLRSLLSAGRPPPPNTKPFIVQCADAAAVLGTGTCGLNDIFTRALAADVSQPAGDMIVCADGWTEQHTQDIVAASPRALWLMSRAGLIPISEEQALEAVIASGKQIEPRRVPVAKVQTIQDPLLVLRMRAFGRGPARAVPVEIVRVR